MLEAQVKSDTARKPFPLRYCFHQRLQESLDPGNGDPFLAAALLPAMSTGETLEISASISPGLVRALDGIQALCRLWDKTLSPIRVKAHVRDGHAQVSRPRSVTGLFFSCGVDSYYSLLRNVEDHPDDEDAVSDLIVVRGFDTAFGGAAPVFQRILANTMIVARQFGKNVVPVATNVRDFGTQYVRWGELYFGAALASIALALESVFEKVHIASSFRHNQPLGTITAVLDPLWSTEHLSIVYDHSEVARVDKTRFIVRYPVVTDTLRVCTYHPFSWSVYNCGVCEKCLRTMVALHIAGALRKSRTLPNFIDLRVLREIHITRALRGLSEELVANLGSSETDLAIRSSLQRSLSRTPRTQWAPARSSPILRLAAYVPSVLGVWVRLWRVLRRSPPSSILDLLPFLS